MYHATDLSALEQTGHTGPEKEELERLFGQYRLFSLFVHRTYADADLQHSSLYTAYGGESHRIGGGFCAFGHERFSGGDRVGSICPFRGRPGGGGSDLALVLFQGCYGAYEGTERCGRCGRET